MRRPVRKINPEARLTSRKLTITLDERVYDGLFAVVGRKQVSRFIERLVRPHVLSGDLADGYCAMALDETREAEALAWAEATIQDVAHEAR